MTTMSGSPDAALVELPDAVRVRPGDVRIFEYDRHRVTAGIAHFGVGNFHRVHEALYTEDCLERDGHSGWGILGIGLTDGPAAREKADVYRRQDGLYSVTEFEPSGGSATRIVGAMVEYLCAPADPAAVLDRLCSPDIRIVSLTITEGGYFLDEATGEFCADDPDVVRDLTGSSPLTAFGYLARALARRRAAGIAPFTVMSCDNLRSNGDTTRRALVGHAHLIDPQLARWIEQEVAFPNSMVDRIAPVVNADRAEQLRRLTGLADAVPAVGESFRQWVIQDNFPTGRPRWEQAGAELRDDVAAFEAVKGRMLNASHMLLSYPALLAGHRLVHEAMTDPVLVDLLRTFLDHDAIPFVQGPPGLSLTEYRDTILNRFGNPAVGDQLLRVASDGASKIPTFHARTIQALLDGGHDMSREALLVACFRRYLSGTDGCGEHFEPFEPRLSAEDLALLRSDDPVAALRAAPFAVLNLDRAERFVTRYLEVTGLLADTGVASAVEAVIA